MNHFNPVTYQMLQAKPNRTSIFSAWNEHLPFAMILIEMLRPRKIAELGTHAGVSYSAFCQAIHALGLDCKAFAVDTWEGDDDTGPYGGEVYPELRSYNTRYSDFSTLLRMTFDDALQHIPDHSIDLLHIDGLHSKDAVEHDFVTWRPKLSDRAIVLMHDTAVKEAGFGVHEFWGEVIGERRNFMFDHGHGLGVLAVGTDLPTAMIEFFESANARPEATKALFASLGRRWQLEVEASAPTKAKAKRASIYAAKLRKERWSARTRRVKKIIGIDS